MNNNLAPILTMSFGLCEDKMSASYLGTYNTLWQQAAAQGITGSCRPGMGGPQDVTRTMRRPAPARSERHLLDPLQRLRRRNAVHGHGQSVALLERDERLQPGVGQVVHSRAGLERERLGTGGAGLWSTGGGPSKVYAKPSWQAAPGVPADGFCDTPDVSLSAAAHDGYIVFKEYDPAVGTFGVFSGTSASSPAFAGIMALAVQKTGSRAGECECVLLPPRAVAIAWSIRQFFPVFHDVTTGNNTVPGVTGFSAGVYYDLATGLGSVDAAALVNSFTVSSGVVANFSFTPPSPSAGQTVLHRHLDGRADLVVVGFRGRVQLDRPEPDTHLRDRRGVPGRAHRLERWRLEHGDEDRHGRGRRGEYLRGGRHDHVPRGRPLPDPQSLEEPVCGRRVVESFQGEAD